MVCSNCGKTISTVGKVCPYCKADKTSDKETQSISLAVGFTAGIIAYLTTNEAGQTIGWAIAGLVMGFVFSKIIQMLRRTRKSNTNGSAQNIKNR